MATIQHYELGKKLGSGDMGSVFQATDTRTDEQVALKILHNIDMQSAMDRGAAAEVLEFAAGITHAAMHPILKVIDTDERGGILAVAMPLAAASVYDFMQAGKRIPPNRVYTVIETIASVLQNLHQNEIAHGSVKPTNVLLDRSGNAALTDLAMAHLRDMGMIPAEATLLQQHYIHVDLMYHSTPEFAADIFALATLAYHMLTYKLPHSDPRPAIRQSEKPSQETLGSEMFAVLLRGMTHRKMLVYPDVGSFMEDFKCAFNGQSIDSETEHWFRVKVRSDDEDED